MIDKRVIFPVFILVALIQWYVPVKMIFDREDVLSEGVEFKFRTAPIDPIDPFRGAYIALRYRDNTVEITNPESWKRGMTIYVSLAADREGFAKIVTAYKQKPVDAQSYLEVKVNHMSSDGSNKLTIDFPFDRFYMEETLAPAADSIFLSSDSNQNAYALVNIKEGRAVLKDVVLRGKSISDLVKSQKHQTK